MAISVRKHVTANATGTCAVGEFIVWVDCRGTKEARHEAARQVGWVLTPVGLRGLCPPGTLHAGPVRAGSACCCCLLSWDDTQHPENSAPPWLRGLWEAWSLSWDKSVNKDAAEERRRIRMVVIVSALGKKKKEYQVVVTVPSNIYHSLFARFSWLYKLYACMLTYVTVSEVWLTFSTLYLVSFRFLTNSC